MTLKLYVNVVIYNSCHFRHHGVEWKKTGECIVDDKLNDPEIICECMSL